MSTNDSILNLLDKMADASENVVQRDYGHERENQKRVAKRLAARIDQIVVYLFQLSQKSCECCGRTLRL